MSASQHEVSTLQGTSGDIVWRHFWLSQWRNGEAAGTYGSKQGCNWPSSVHRTALPAKKALTYKSQYCRGWETLIQIITNISKFLKSYPSKTWKMRRWKTQKRTFLSRILIIKRITVVCGCYDILLHLKDVLKIYHLYLHYSQTVRSAGKSARILDQNTYPETFFTEQGCILTDCVKIK